MYSKIPLILFVRVDRILVISGMIVGRKFSGCSQISSKSFPGMTMAKAIILVLCTMRSMTLLPSGMGLSTMRSRCLTTDGAFSCLFLLILREYCSAFFIALASHIGGMLSPIASPQPERDVQG